MKQILDFLIDLAPLIQAIFAGLLFWLIVKQTGISKAQKEISAQNTELQKKMDESNKLLGFWNEYATLSDSRRALYHNIRSVILNTYLGEPMSIDSLVEESGFPPGFEPSEVEDFLGFVAESDRKGLWNGLPLWDFSKFVYSYQDSSSVYERQRADGQPWQGTVGDYPKNIDKARSKLAYFWQKWTAVLDISRHFQPDQNELVILSWLELALVLKTKHTTGSAKTGLLTLAKAKWESARVSQEPPRTS